MFIIELNSFAIFLGLVASILFMMYIISILASDDIFIKDILGLSIILVLIVLVIEILPGQYSYIRADKVQSVISEDGKTGVVYDAKEFNCKPIDEKYIACERKDD